MIKTYWIRVGEGRRDCSEQCNHGDAVVELHVDDRNAGFFPEMVVSCGNVLDVLPDWILYHTEVISQDTYMFAMQHSRSIKFEAGALIV
jgi:hypothetical protein